MSNLDKTQLSQAIIDDMKKFAKTGEDPIFWLANDKNVSVDEIITRMQSANIESVIDLGVKDEEQWKMSNPNYTLRKSVAPITNTDKYSSFALVENADRIGRLRYPLVASYASKNLFFSTKTFSGYSHLIDRIKSAYKVKIVERNDSGELFSYKRKGRIRAMLKNKGIGAVNLCRKLFKKQVFKPSISYKGKIVINSSISVGNNQRYKFAEQEKLTRILYALTTITSKELAKQNKIKLDKKVMAYANLYANVLISRAINYGSSSANRVVEASLSLQMCNTLAGLDIDKDTLKKANDLGMQTALYTINKLGLTKEQVMSAMRATGYTYQSTPNSIKEAIAPRRAYVNEDTYVKEAEDLIGIEHDNDKAQDNRAKTAFTANTNKDVLKDKEKTNTTNQETVKTKTEDVKKDTMPKHEKDVLDNPGPDDVIYLPGPKEKEALDNPAPDNVIYLGCTQEEYEKQKQEEKSKNKIDDTTADELNTDDLVAWGDAFAALDGAVSGETKYSTLDELEGVKTTDVYLTRRSAEKYIDRVVLTAIRRNIDGDVNKISTKEETSKVAQRAKRRYNFLEHLYTYYDRNKDKDTEVLQDSVDKELSSAELSDNIYAHSYAKSVVDLRQSILTDIFGEADKILKPEGKGIIAVVNDYAEDKYKSKLSTYVKGALKVCLKTIFKEIDEKNFEQKNLTEPVPVK